MWRQLNCPLASGPALALMLVWLGPSWGLSPAAAGTAGLAAWCALWWVFEPVPIPVTSLLPLAILPLGGILTPAQVAQAYGSPLILLLLGGFILSRAMEHNDAHRRLALSMVRLCGGQDQRRLVLGFMLAAALLSMWISNTATTLMLLPVATAVLAQHPRDGLAASLFLGIAYAASIGGMATPIGTPPNLVFMQIYGQHTGATPSFSQWMSWGLPVVAVLLPLAGLWLTRRLGGRPAPQVPAVGAWQAAEIRTLLVFAITALLWVTRQEPWGGWSTWLDLPRANDASVALLAVVSLFLIPNGRGARLLDWASAEKIPWGVLILFGGGIAIATAFEQSGLGPALGESLAVVGQWPLWLALLLVCAGVTFMTELTSNTATTVLLMPVLAVAGTTAGIDPALLMVPAAMSASCAFMLPVATAPNAIVYGSGQVSSAQMARAGLIVNLCGILAISLVVAWRLG